MVKAKAKRQPEECSDFTSDISMAEATADSKVKNLFDLPKYLIKNEMSIETFYSDLPT